MKLFGLLSFSLFLPLRSFSILLLMHFPIYDSEAYSMLHATHRMQWNARKLCAGNNSTPFHFVRIFFLVHNLQLLHIVVLFSCACSLSQSAEILFFGRWLFVARVSITHTKCIAHRLMVMWEWQRNIAKIRWNDNAAPNMPHVSF